MGYNTRMVKLFEPETQFHLRIKKGDIGKFVLLCGDPGRVEKIAEHFDNAKFVVFNREYKIYTGYLNGVKVSAVSHGIGGPGAAICVEELIKCGAHTFIRIGTSGGMAEKVKAGDLCIASAAVRDDGTSAEYLPVSYPAAADFDIMCALSDAAKKLKFRHHVGVVQSKDSFYGETNPETMAVAEYLKNRWKAEIRLNCLCSEMECAAIFAVALTRNVRAGGVMLAIWNAEDPDTNIVEDTSAAIKCAVEALTMLIKNDKLN